MKTTIDLPDALWQKAKILAVQEKTDLRSIVVAALEAYLRAKR